MLHKHTMFSIAQENNKVQSLNADTFSHHLTQKAE